jgi:class 3 adenylate cyclase
MTDIIEAEGGLVDKYIGDAIVAVFGVPVDDDHHALHAVRAALACQARLAALSAGTPAFAGHQLSSRIGLATGEALVGNVGSRRRFNYTAMGDTVNLAARLEGANKGYGTSILASEATREAAGDAVAWREIDRVRVVGRQAPVGLFEPLGLAGEASPARLGLVAAFAGALADFRARRFAEAAGRFAALAGEDAVARRYAERAERFRAEPPPDSWDGVTTLETK